MIWLKTAKTLLCYIATFRQSRSLVNNIPLNLTSLVKLLKLLTISGPNSKIVMKVIKFHIFLNIFTKY